MNTVPRYALTPADLAEWQEVRAVCVICRHWAVFDVRGLDPHTRLVRLEPKLRCTRCGNRTYNYFVVGPREGRNGER